MKLRTRLGVFIGLVMLLAGLVARFWFLPSGYAAPIERFNKVVPGMTEAQVQDIMGAPDRIRHDRPRSATYFYGGLRHLKLCSMEVDFGADGTVTGKFHDD